MLRYFANLGPALFVIALLNFFVFANVALIIGGDAINGKIENGVYFVAGNGGLTKVSHSVWIYSYWHAISVFVTFPLGFLGMALYDRRKTKPESTE